MTDFGLNLALRILRIEPIFRILCVITCVLTQKPTFPLQNALFTRRADISPQIGPQLPPRITPTTCQSTTYHHPPPE